MADIDIDTLERRIGSSFDNEVTLTGDEMRALAAEVRRLRATIAAMTPVVSAAEQVFDCDGSYTNEQAALVVLDDAVEAYRAAKAKEQGHG